VAGIRGVIQLDGPALLPGVKHKIVVLEYDNPGSGTWGKDISQILAHEVLGTVSGISGVGIINLEQPEYKRVDLSSENIQQIGTKQEASIVIWGEFYSDSVNVFLHSRLRVIPQSELSLSASGLGAYPMNATPPTFQIDFAPITVSIETLNNLSSYFNQTTTIKDAPHGNGKTIGTLPVGAAYYLLQKEGEWTRIQVRNGSTGWVRLSTLGAQKELKEVQSVVTLSQGILQLLAGNFRASEQSLKSYLDLFGNNQDNMNRSFAYLLLGTAKLRNYENPLTEFEKAANLLPNHASPINYLAIAYLLEPEDIFYDVVKAQELERRLILGIKSQNNLESIQNLQSFYSIALYRGMLNDGSLSHEEFTARLHQRISLLNEIKEKVNESRGY